MARLKDENKRIIILQTAKMLYAHNGFYNTSIADIAKETGLPIGSIYTYFKSKDHIISTIVEEGWAILYDRLKEKLASNATAVDKLRSILDDYIPELLEDLDFINIILTETLAYTKIEDKMEKLTELIFQLLVQISDNGNIPAPLSRKDMETALAIYFLGILSTAKLTRAASVGIRKDDIIRFLKNSISQTMGIKF